MLFDLNSGSIAQYRWGTLFCYYSPAAPVSKGTFINLLVGLIEQRAPWDSDEEFRATAALAHELVHYQQDILTGLGHWDYLMHVNEIFPWLYQGGRLWRELGDWVPYERRFVGGVEIDCNRLKYIPFRLQSRETGEAIRTSIHKEFGGALPDSMLSDMSIEALLEAEAAFTVVRVLRTLQMSDSQFEILKRNKDYYDPGCLGEMYVSAWQHLTTVLMHHCAVDAAIAGKMAQVLFPLLVDLASAHPPPKYLNANHLDVSEFDPCLKYLRLLLAFQKLSGKRMEDFLQHLQEGDFSEVEAILFEKCVFPYPRSEEVYRAWQDELAEKADQRIADLRLEMCAARLREAQIGAYKFPGTFVTTQAPIVYIDKTRGYQFLGWGKLAIDQEEQLRFMGELLGHYQLTALIDFIFRTGEFRCPYAMTDTCQAVADRCFSGITNLAQLPRSDECLARSVLTQVGFWNPGESEPTC